MSNSNQYNTLKKVLGARCINSTMSCVIFQHFYYRKRGEGGGQKVMIGIIISENVDNYGRPPMTLQKKFWTRGCPRKNTSEEINSTGHVFGGKKL